MYSLVGVRIGREGPINPSSAQGGFVFSDWGRTVSHETPSHPSPPVAHETLTSPALYGMIYDFLDKSRET